MLDIYYAQQSKVSEIKQACFDFVASCYTNADKSITAAMQTLTDGNDIVINPDKLALTDQMCIDYVKSCDGMFGGDGTNGIVAQYVASQKQTDMLASCRAVAKQCFDKYGGSNYENFYYPYSGLFQSGRAPDWFTLYDKTVTPEGDAPYPLLSPCAKQLSEIVACKNNIEDIFGGFDRYAENDRYKYGTEKSSEETRQRDIEFADRRPRPTGVATEVYNQVLSVLSNQCMNVNGRFVETQNASIESIYNKGSCQFASTLPDYYAKTFEMYNIKANEYICPRGYDSGVDTASWGICSCWANGARRSQDGYTTKCVDKYRESPESNTWVDGSAISSDNQLCVYHFTETQNNNLNITCTPVQCTKGSSNYTCGGESKDKLPTVSNLPKGI